MNVWHIERLTLGTFRDAIYPNNNKNVEKILLKAGRHNTVIQQKKKETDHTILHEHLSMHKLSAKWSPKQMIVNQKANKGSSL